MDFFMRASLHQEAGLELGHCVKRPQRYVSPVTWPVPVAKGSAVLSNTYTYGFILGILFTSHFEKKKKGCNENFSIFASACQRPWRFIFGGKQGNTQQKHTLMMFQLQLMHLSCIWQTESMGEMHKTDIRMLQRWSADVGSGEKLLRESSPCGVAGFRITAQFSSGESTQIKKQDVSEISYAGQHVL